MDRIKNIIDIIKENKDISDFKLIRKKTSSKELFLIRDAIDTVSYTHLTLPTILLV